MLALVYATVGSGSSSGGDAVFNAPSASFGSTVAETNTTTFTLSSPGLYEVTYHLGTSLLSLLGSASVQLNGSTIGQTSTLASAGATIADNVVVEVTTADVGTSGAVVQLAVGGLTLSGTGDITITQLAS